MKTKTQIAIAVTLGVLFLAVPSATPKGKPAPAGLTLSATCFEAMDGTTDTGTDSCSVNGTGLTADTYLLTGTSDCGVESSSNVSPGQLWSPSTFRTPAATVGASPLGCTLLKEGSRRWWQEARPSLFSPSLRSALHPPKEVFG